MLPAGFEYHRPSSLDEALSLLSAHADDGKVLTRVHAPAGLDLGAVSHEEIAVAILAEIVKEKAAGEIAAGVPSEHAQHGRHGHEATDVDERHESIDPVCGMTVDVATARNVAAHEGRTYYFCSAGCLATFEADPATYAATASDGLTRRGFLLKRGRMVRR